MLRSWPECLEMIIWKRLQLRYRKRGQNIMIKVIAQRGNTIKSYKLDASLNMPMDL